MTAIVSERVRALMLDGKPRTARQIAYELEPNLRDYDETILLASVRKTLRNMEKWG